MNAEFGTSSPGLSQPPVSVNPLKTESVATEACQLALKGVSELMSLLIHDLANPLQSLTMQLELSSDPNDNGRGLDVDALLSTSQEVGQILNQMSAFFYRHSPQAPCQLRTSLTQLEDAMLQRLRNRGILWETKFPRMPDIPHNCAIPELVLLRCLIYVGYQLRRDRGVSLRLHSTVTLLGPMDAKNQLDLRVQLELLDPLGTSIPMFTPEKESSMITLMSRLGSGFSCSTLVNNRVQLDFRLPSPR